MTDKPPTRPGSSLTVSVESQSSVDNFFKGKYDLIVSNPPYINSLKLKYLEKDILGYEPIQALKGGLDGFNVFNKIIKMSSILLKKGGKLVLEIGFDQKFEMLRILKKKNFYNKEDMEDIKIAEGTTEAGFKKNSFVYEFMSSMRQKINDPLGQRAKKAKQIKQR